MMTVQVRRDRIHAVRPPKAALKPDESGYYEPAKTDFFKSFDRSRTSDSLPPVGPRVTM